MAVVAIGVSSPAFSPSTFSKAPSFCSPLSIAPPPSPFPPQSPPLPVPSPVVESTTEEKESSGLSRKRPARLSIPMMGLAGFGEARAREVGAEEVEVRENTYGAYSKRGKRGRLQDRFSAVVGIQGDSKQVVFHYGNYEESCVIVSYISH